MVEEIKKLLRHTSVYGLGNILNKAVGFLLIPFYTHYLTTADYGTLELLDLSAALVGLLLNMWMNASLVRYYYDYDDQPNRNDVVSTALLATTVIAALVSALGMLLARDISALVLKSPAFYKYIWLISGTLFLTCINSVSWSYLRARQRSGLIVVANAISLALSLALNIYFIAGLKTGLIGILYSGIISNLVVTAALTVMTVKEVGVSFDWHKLKALAAFGTPLILTSFSAFELNFADRFFLQHFSTISVVGIYALGYKFGYMLSFLVVQPFMMIWGARMYEVAKTKDAGEALSRIFTYFTLVLVSVGLFMSLVIKDVISVVADQRFHDAYKVVPVVALAYVFYGMSYYFQTGIYVQKKTLYLGLMGLICAGSNIGLNFWLIPRYAALGAAWATAASFLIMAVLAYAFGQSVYRIPYALSRTAILLASAAGVYFLSTLLPPFPRFIALAMKLALLAVFGAGILLFGFFDAVEKRKLMEVWQSARGRNRLGMANASGR